MVQDHWDYKREKNRLLLVYGLFFLLSDQQQGNSFNALLLGLKIK